MYKDCMYSPNTIYEFESPGWQDFNLALITSARKVDFLLRKYLDLNIPLQILGSHPNYDTCVSFLE